MKLYEYQAAGLFRSYDIPAPQGVLITNPMDLVWDRFPAVIKAQVLSGGRAKAGGIQFARTLEEARLRAAAMLGSTIAGFPVRKVLVVGGVEVLREYYFSYAVDRAARSITAVFSAEGGVDIEETSCREPEKVVKFALDPRLSAEAAGRMVAEAAARTAPSLDAGGFRLLAQNLFRFFVENEAELAEINPLADTDTGLLALDAKVAIDDNSLFRHPDLEALGAEGGDEQHSERELEAAAQGLSYVEMDGQVAVIGCGAGLVMATLDLIGACGARPACFLDMGGGASTDKMKAALDIVCSRPQVKAVLINAFCGITRCDDLARGIVEYHSPVPLFIRLTGTNEESGVEILKNHGISVSSSMEETSRKAAAAAK